MRNRDNEKKPMAVDSFYLSNDNNTHKLLEITELSHDEVEDIVGRFAKHSSRAGQLRGEVVVYVDDSVAIRHHFTKKILWSQDDEWYAKEKEVYKVHTDLASRIKTLKETFAGYQQECDDLEIVSDIGTLPEGKD